jgi:hypothetical protein
MARLGKFTPGVSIPVNVASRFSASRRRGNRSVPASCVFYKNRDNYIVFELIPRKCRMQNRWQVLFYRSATNRFSIRVKDAGGNIIATITNSSGAAAAIAAMNSSSTIGPFCRGRIVGTIGSTDNFSSDINDYCRFTGGS